VQAHPVALPDEPVLGAEAPDQPQADVPPPAPCALDASDDVRRDATDAADLRRASSVAGAEKLAAPALDARA